MPEFQRQFVWRPVQARKLIESFLLGLPVPAIFLYTEYDSQKKLLVDGQQRLKSIAYFFSGYFGEEYQEKRSVFRLKGISENSKYHNKTFDDLNEEDQRKLKDSVLRAFIIQQLSPKDDTSIYHVFERLNTGGTFLNNQEVRNCVYYGDFNDLIKQRLNLDDNWRKILGKAEPDKRMIDHELILRFLSLTCNVQNYEKPLKDHISKYLKRHRNPSKDFLNATENTFNRTCEIVFKTLGEKPFHIKRGLNAAAFDCVMAAFAKNLNKFPEVISEKKQKRIKTKYKELINELDTQKLITSGTTDISVVKKRFELAEHYLFPGDE
ncbi:MAG: DUF262 domain-containing protein [Nitrospinales bacterium]